MAGLRIKHYAKSGMLRSVGDAPNGIVAVSFFGGAHWIVHPKAQPEESPHEITVHVLSGGDPEEDGAVPLTVEEVFEAAAGCKRTIAVLWEAACIALHNEAGKIERSFDAEGVLAAATFVKDCRDQLAVLGFIGKREE